MTRNTELLISITYNPKVTEFNKKVQYIRIFLCYETIQLENANFEF